MCDGNGIPLSSVTTSANRHEITIALATVDKCYQQSNELKPKRLCADKGYDSNWLAEALLERNIQPYLVPRHWQSMVRHVKTRRRGRPPGHRWKVERAHAWCNQQRRIASFYEKSISTYDAFVTMACIRFYLRKLHKNTLS
ncbi:MAG: transposase [bacterium]